MNAGSPAPDAAVLSRLSVLWAVFLLPLAFWTQFEDAFKLPQFMLALALGLAAIRLKGFRLRGWQWPLLWLGCSHLASFALGPDPRLSDTLWFLAFVCAGLFLPAHISGAKAGSRLLDLATVSAALAAAYSVVQFIGMDVIGGMTDRLARPFSTMGNPDFFAAYLLAVMPVALIRAVRQPSVTRIAAVLLIASGLLLAQSRGAWLGILGAGMAVAAAVRLSGRPLRPSRTAGALIAVCLLAGGGFIFISPVAHGRFAGMFNLRNFDAAGRLLMWDASMRMIRERPLVGLGLGGYGKVYPAWHARALEADRELPYFFTENAHNDFLQLGAEEGIFILGIWGWVWLVFLRLAWSRWLQGSWEALGLLGGFAGFQLNALFNFPWYLLPAQGWFWVSFAWLAAGFSPPAPPGRRSVAYIRLVILTAAFIPIGRALQANAWLKISGDAAAVSAWPRALYSAGRSLGRWALWEGKERAAANAALAAYGLGNWKESEDFARIGLAAAPASPALYNQLGLCLARQGKYAQAEEACRRGLALNPRQAEGYHALGNIAYLRGDPEGAARFWRRALEENPGLQGARMSLEQALSGERK